MCPVGFPSVLAQSWCFRMFCAHLLTWQCDGAIRCTHMLSSNMLSSISTSISITQAQLKSGNMRIWIRLHFTITLKLFFHLESTLWTYGGRIITSADFTFSRNEWDSWMGEMRLIHSTSEVHRWIINDPLLLHSVRAWIVRFLLIVLTVFL